MAAEHPGAGTRHFPLSPSQQLFWRGHALTPGAPIYNMAWRFSVFADLVPQVFQDAFEDVARASDAMRAVFGETDGTPYQTLGSLPLFPQVLDLSDHPDPQVALDAWMVPWVSAPFDLTRSNYRTQLVRLGSAHWVWCHVQHHIVCDAQAGRVLFDAVAARYQALTEDRAEVQPALPSSFDRCEAHANGQEADAPAPPRHVVSRRAGPYGAGQPDETASIRHRVQIEDALHAAIARCVDDPDYRLFTPDLSRFAVFLTAFAAFHHRVTGDEEISVGIPAHNRMSPQDKDVIGLFVEVLPLQLTVAPDDTFQTLYAKVRDAIGTFLREARPGAVARIADPGVSAVLNVIQARFGTFAGMPCAVEYVHSGAQDRAHALRLQVMDFAGSGQSEMALDIRADLLRHTHADWIVAHFRAVLWAMVDAPETLIAEVDLTPQEEQTRLAEAHEGPSEDQSAEETVLAQFHAWVRSDPDRVALVCGTEQLSYGALDQRANAVARMLHEHDVRAGEAVLVHMRRSPDCVAAILAVLKAGACFVPVAANMPLERCRRIAALSEARVALVDADFAGRLEGVTPLQVDGAAVSGRELRNEIRKTSLAYVLYTSGSTGEPKGVAVDHGNFARYIRWAARSFGGGGPADYAFFSSISFDLTLTSIFAPLVSGGRVQIYPERATPDLAVLDVFAGDCVDVVKLTPSHLSLVCETGQRVARIRTLVLGGENLTRHLCLRAHEVLSPDLKIVNEYGPTEAVVGAMIHRFDPATDLDQSVPIGRPADGVQISVRDAALNPLPHGVTGEICIAGRLSQGYFNRPDLTDAAFVPDPLQSDALLYRTGDLGRLRLDGTFEYLGRADHQLKVGGVRIETAEIEAAICAAPGVLGAHLVAGRPERASDPGQTCARCGIADNVPDVALSAEGICSICAGFDAIRDRAAAYFETPSVLQGKLRAAADRRRGPYDAIMLLSGGKDSSYAAYRLAEITDRVLALTLDNGFLSDEAKVNIRNVAADLGWDHRFMTTPVMNAIFVDSLKTFSNVCQGCFKTVYSLALRVARDEGVPAIVTGLSRGQFFETRLTPDLFTASCPSTAELEGMVTEARRRYHAQDDAVARLLETSDIRDGSLLDEVEFIDLYRYIDVPVSEIYRFLSEHTAWVRPADTGRSTNCKINDVGIYVHQKRAGYHNYAVPYSWDVRMGHKTREQALHELNDEIDPARVQAMLDEIGFDEPIVPEGRSSELIAYAVAETGVQDADVWDAIRQRLPREVQPTHLVLLDAMPLTPNGKVDTARLPPPSATSRAADFVAPRDAREQQLAELFAEVLGQGRVGVHDDFFDLGGDSLAAIRIAIRANEEGLAVSTTALFSHSTVARLARELGPAPVPRDDVSSATESLIDLDVDDLAAIRQALT